MEHVLLKNYFHNFLLEVIKLHLSLIPHSSIEEIFNLDSRTAEKVYERLSNIQM